MFKLERKHFGITGCAAKETTRYCMTDVSVRPLADNRGVIEATDGRCLARFECDAEPGAHPLRLEAKALGKCLRSVKRTPASVTNGQPNLAQVTVDGTTTNFETDSDAMPFPDTDAVVPKIDDVPHEIAFDADVLTKVLDAVPADHQGNRPFRLRFGEPFRAALITALANGHKMLGVVMPVSTSDAQYLTAAAVREALVRK